MNAETLSSTATRTQPATLSPALPSGLRQVNMLRSAPTMGPIATLSFTRTSRPTFTLARSKPWVRMLLFGPSGASQSRR